MTKRPLSAETSVVLSHWSLLNLNSYPSAKIKLDIVIHNNILKQNFVRMVNAKQTITLRIESSTVYSINSINKCVK